MAHRSCPNDKAQDGVCGCPEFWKHAKSRASKSTPAPPTTLPIRTTKDTNNMRSPSPTPPGGPKHTCFFWYHGQCRRGDSCQYEHRTHVTWPIVPPPGFVHFGPCVLAYCPLNSGLVLLNEQNAKTREAMGMGGQGDGAFMSRPATVADGDEEGGVWDEIPAGVSLAGSTAECSDAIDEFQEAVATSDQGGANNDPAALLSPTPSTGSMEPFGISGAASPLPASEVGDEPVVSPIHLGTIAKRCRSSPSPVTQRKRSHPDLSPVNPQQNFAQQLPPRPTTQEALPVSLPADTAHHLPPKPGHAPVISGADLFALTSRSRKLPKAFNPPKGPRALRKETATPQPDPDICFFYYHHGVCVPKRRRGRPHVCKYSHTDPVPGAKVSQPQNITYHSADCSLPLCPIRMAQQGSLGVNQQELPSDMGSAMKVEPQEESGPMLSFYPEHGYTSRSNMGIQENKILDHQAMESDKEPAIKSTNGPMFNKYSRHSGSVQLTKITGPARERFKEQKKRVEKWQVENGINPDSVETKLLNKRMMQQVKTDKSTMKRRKKDRKRKRRMDRERDAPRMIKAEIDAMSLNPGGNRVSSLFGTTNRERHESILREAGLLRTNFTSVILTPEAANTPGNPQHQLPPDAIARPAKKKRTSNNLLRSRRAHNLFQTDMTNGGATVMFDPEAELYSETLRPIYGFPAPSTTPDVRDEREDKSHSFETAMKGIHAMRMSRGRSRPLPTAQPVSRAAPQVEQDAVHAPPEPAANEYKILVDYELPMGDDRLDWDSDFVRRAFGEIE